MKSVIAIFFLVLVLSAQTPVGQLLKIPGLIEHLIKHQKQEGVSLIDFLEDHYITDHNDADLPEDEKLPFKKIIYNAIGYAIVPEIIKTNAFVPLPSDKKVFFPDIYTTQQHLASIFHPPRI